MSDSTSMVLTIKAIIAKKPNNILEVNLIRLFKSLSSQALATNEHRDAK